MEVAQFYFHLPSNSSLDKFPNNTLTEYRVCLPQTVSLTGDWEVALTEIHYPHSWNNVQENFENRFYLRNQELDGMWEALIVPPGHYSSVADVITKINEVVSSNGRFKDEVQLSFDTLNRKSDRTLTKYSRSVFFRHRANAGIFAKRSYFQNFYRRQRSGLRSRLSRSLRLL